MHITRKEETKRDHLIANLSAPPVQRVLADYQALTGKLASIYPIASSVNTSYPVLDSYT